MTETPQVPDPQHPEFRRLAAILDDEAVEATADKEAALAELESLATDEEIRAEIGLDMDALRRD